MVALSLPRTKEESRHLLNEINKYQSLEDFASAISETLRVVEHWHKRANDILEGNYTPPNYTYEADGFYTPPNVNILFFDIEMYMALLKDMYVWDTINIDLDRIPPYLIKRYKSMAMFSFSWFHSHEIYNVSCLDDRKAYYSDKFDDYHVTKRLWDLFNQADIVVAHNGDKFDIKHFNSRCIFHGLPIPKKVKTIDTLKVANKVFGRGAMGNSLSNLAQFLQVAQKKHAPNWEKLSSGDTPTLIHSIPYCDGDILTMKQIFRCMWLLGYMQDFMNLKPIAGQKDGCDVCLKHDTLEVIGKDYTKKQAYELLRCSYCNSQQRGEKIAYV